MSSSFGPAVQQIQVDRQGSCFINFIFALCTGNDEDNKTQPTLTSIIIKMLKPNESFKQNLQISKFWEQVELNLLLKSF